MQKKIFFVLIFFFIAFIFYQGFHHYPFSTKGNLENSTDHNFFDPDEDHFFDLETQ